MTRIYSDIIAYQMMTEGGSVQTYFIDKNGSHYRPNLIIPNLLALKRLKQYCEEKLAEHPDPELPSED